MSVGVRHRRFPHTSSTPNINEASIKDITASLHRNVLSWCVWWGQEEKASVSIGAITHSAYSQTADSGSYDQVSNLSRTAGVPDVVGRSPETAFSSITITARKVLPSHSISRDAMNSVSPPPERQEPFRGGVSSMPTSTNRVSNSQLAASWPNPTIVMPSEFKRVYSAADELAVRDHGQSKVQPGRNGLSYTEGDRMQDMIGGSLVDLSPQPSYRSCIHLEIPMRSTCSFVLLDKLLSISLVELEGRRADQPTLYRSTLFVQLGVSPCHRCSADNKPAKTNGGYKKPGAAMFGHNSNNGQGNDLGQSGRPPPKHQGCEVGLIRPTCGINGKANDSGTQRHSNALGLMSLRGPSLSITMVGGQRRNADEAAFLTGSNFRHKEPTSNSVPVDSRTWSEQARSDTTKERQEPDCAPEPQKVSASDETCLRLMANSLEGTSTTLSPKEALELLRPGFISRSQDRVRRLEQRAMKGRALRNSNPDLVQGLGDDRRQQKRNCTTPDPLSDHLFKPRERSISDKEMQLRSRRIYSKLPEVTKKKEEEEKRAVLQTNRLRAEVFKKRLLDQILQR